ncbi:MAG: type II secretion system protein [Planctomycetota bacterium]|jgi:prepilin-type N-terminal cleavage/methylation domain-containing protein/prepilin-type processing-associated H-X9-DG protein
MRTRGLTLLELLVVISIIALVMGILVPTLSGARYQAQLAQGGANLQQLTQANLAYLNDNDDHLPQVRIRPDGSEGDGPSAILFEWLYAGKRVESQVFNINAWSADRRPLNAYLGDPSPDDPVEICLDPLDAGTSDQMLHSLAGTSALDSSPRLYDLVGTSYLLNDHALDRVPCPFVEIFPTLIPKGGGRMPVVDSPSRTWLVGQGTIYNFDDGEDDRMNWHPGSTKASLAFGDGHVTLANDVSPDMRNTTSQYTFYPREDWHTRFPHAAGLDSH